MADIRIKDLTTTASSTASDDFIAVDGATNGTRKLNAYSPSFGGNATVAGTLTVSGGSGIVTQGGGSDTTLQVTQTGTAGAYCLLKSTAAPSAAFGGYSFEDAGSVRWFIGGQGGYANSAHDFNVTVNGAYRFRIDTAGVSRVLSTTASTTTSTGALVVSGGLGVGGSLNAGAVHAANSITGGDTGFGTSIIQFKDGSGSTKINFKGNGEVTMSATTASTSTSTGALVVNGGVGVAGALYVGSKGQFQSNDDALSLKYSTDGGACLLAWKNTSGTTLWSIGGGIDTRQDELVFRRTTTTVLNLDSSNNATFAGNIKTAAPAGGTAAAWKLGTVASVSPTSPNRTIEVDIGGTIYYIHAKTTNN